MRQSIIDYPKFLILCDGRPVGCLSCKALKKEIHEVGCLCVIPEFRGKGIGTAAMEFARSYYRDRRRFSLATPADKDENVRFYTKKAVLRSGPLKRTGTSRRSGPFWKDKRRKEDA